MWASESWCGSEQSKLLSEWDLPPSWRFFWNAGCRIFWHRRYLSVLPNGKFCVTQKLANSYTGRRRYHLTYFVTTKYAISCNLQSRCLHLDTTNHWHILHNLSRQLSLPNTNFKEWIHISKLILDAIKTSRQYQQSDRGYWRFMWSFL